MTEPEEQEPTNGAPPERVRRRVLQEEEKPEDPQRQGCMRLAMFLGIGAGVVAAVFILPWALDFFFQPEEVGVGEVFEHEGLRVEVLSVRMTEASQWELVLRASRHEAWEAGPHDFALHFPGDFNSALVSEESPARQVPGNGEPVELVLTFGSVAGTEEPPEELRLDNPQVNFALPAPSAP